MKTPDDELGADKTIEPAAFVYKNIHFVGVSLYCDEFSADVRNSSEDLTSGDFSLVSVSYMLTCLILKTLATLAVIAVALESISIRSG